MTDETKKKKGFFKRAFGVKSKDEKLAEAAAEKAAAQQLVDEKMAVRMAAINAAALKSARVQDEVAAGITISDDEAARIEAEEKTQAELQAARDVERAKQLSEERARKAEQEKLAAENKAKQEAEDGARIKAEQEADAARLAQEQAREKALAAEQEKRAKDEAAALEKARKVEGEAQAKALAEKQEAGAKERAQKLAAEQAERDAALAKEQDARDAQDKVREQERLAAEQAVQKREDKRLINEAKQAERRAIVATQEAEKAVIAREQAAEAAAKYAAENPTPEIDPLDEAGFFTRVTKGLSKSTTKMSGQMNTLFNQRTLDDQAIEDLEDLLIASDLGIGPATRVTAALAADKFDKTVTPMEIKIALADVISDILTPLEKPIILTSKKPQIMLFVGVNGSGKTTTLGKLAKRYTDDGKKVLLAAGDTFRAAAVEQLTVWGERSGAPVISGKPGADAAGLIYDAIEAARAGDYDILMIDTAGRLQNRTELMDELSKVVRVITKQDPSAPHHCILVLDATVGQNALMQTEAFQKTAGVSGLIMTKLDGTAKGGVLVALSDKYKLPIHHIGIGERIQDLENFSAPVFAAALSGVADAMLEG
ncbi:MAG: signal recognition particle-docking protein FtsY [Robiginitomaculum sp.]